MSAKKVIFSSFFLNLSITLLFVWTPALRSSPLLTLKIKCYSLTTLPLRGSVGLASLLTGNVPFLSVPYSSRHPSNPLFLFPFSPLLALVSLIFGSALLKPFPFSSRSPRSHARFSSDVSVFSLLDFSPPRSFPLPAFSPRSWAGARPCRGPAFQVLARNVFFFSCGIFFLRGGAFPPDDTPSRPICISYSRHDFTRSSRAF